MRSSHSIVCLFTLSLLVIIYCTLPAFSLRTRLKSLHETPSPLIDLHTASSMPLCRNYPTLLINISTIALLDAALSKLHPRRTVLVIPLSQLGTYASTLRTAARAGHALVLQYDSNTQTEVALFESLLGFPPIFSTGVHNISGAFTLVGLDKPAQVLVDSAVVHWAQDAPVCDGDVGLVSRLDSMQLAYIHERLYCDFVAPGEVMWRFCRDVKAEFERRKGGILGKYASRRDRSAEVDDMRGFVARNRRRVALARELARRGAEDAMFVLYGMSEREVDDYIRGKRRGVRRWEGTRAVRYLAGVTCLIVGTTGVVYNVRSAWRRRGWRLIAKAADFGKIV